MKYLVDTNVLSELARPRPNAGVVRWAGQHKLIGLSVIVVEEIAFGLSWKPNQRISDWLERFLGENCQVFPVTESIARRAGQLRGKLRSQGSNRTQADMLVAATAAEHDLTLVTRNTAHFENCGVSVWDPFER